MKLECWFTGRIKISILKIEEGSRSVCILVVCSITSSMWGLVCPVKFIYAKLVCCGYKRWKNKKKFYISGGGKEKEVWRGQDRLERRIL